MKMANELGEHYGLLLGLTAPWRVGRVEVEVDKLRVQVWVEYEVGAKGRCPECGHECGVHDRAEERTWRHLDTMQFETLIHCRVPRARCPEHGVKTMKTPWAGGHSRYTLLFEAFAINVLQCCSTLVKAAGLLRLDWHSAQEIMSRGVARGLQRRETGDMPHIGMDEKNFGRKKVSTVVTDAQGGRVWDLVPGCDHQAGLAAIETVPPEVRDDILAVSLDMSAAYRKAVREGLPSADIVHDHFHVSKLLCEALDQVRRAEMRELQGPELLQLKGSRYLWLTNEENLSDMQAVRFKELKSSELKVGRAWAVKEAFRHFWTYRSLGCAERFFDRWLVWARSLKLAPITRVAKTLETHFDGLYNYIFHRITNAQAEGFNSAIQSVLSNARGFRSFKTFRVAVLFRLGKLSMLPQ